MRILIQLHFKVHPDPTFDFFRIRNRFMLLTKVMRIWNHWSTDPPRIHFEPIKLLSLYFSADPESGSSFQNLMRIRVDPFGSGSASLEFLTAINKK
jgi:hypothetical protein